ncbi:hypothetical protein ND861_09450 [Leptospira sp. 2 VSF19]|uniref:Flagellar motor switch protein FliM n=2 Tax=Leptospira TaxID=171 RepID=A0AAW5VLU0_9LEPT|nr:MULTISPECIES: hypothetical protein [Leptospira]MCW7467632.1 hypothetical protein [Leptospira levettii]MCW7492570.1 hypothetical protein [Leptospira soteropolitanensis]MCW7500618.1 hypothetical protein [Leptospira soteropolitanensis]MCW7513312.1 hypothetical protein [Leptospira levettii]MCW7517035.1 hypothetical protein [Leptospira levettii]
MKEEKLVLSMEEIDDFLNNLSEGEFNNLNYTKYYDFNRPILFSEEHEHILFSIHSSFATALTVDLRSELDSKVFISIAAIDELHHEEVTRSFSGPTLISTININKYKHPIILIFEYNLANEILNKLLGASNEESSEQVKPFSSFQLLILEDFLEKKILVHLNKEWNALCEMSLSLDFVEGEAWRIKRIPLSSKMLSICFDVNIDDCSELMQIFIPFSSIESILLKTSIDLYNKRNLGEKERCKTTCLEVPGFNVSKVIKFEKGQLLPIHGIRANQ